MTATTVDFTFLVQPIEFRFTEPEAGFAFDVEPIEFKLGPIQGTSLGEANTLVSAATGGGVDLPADPAKVDTALQVRGINAGSSGLIDVTLDAPNEEVIVDVDTDALEEFIMPQLQSLIDEAGQYTYFGFAQPGVLPSQALWRIFRIDETGTLVTDTESVKRYAGGSTDFDQIWDNRTGLTYS